MMTAGEWKRLGRISEASFAQAAFRDQVAKLARIDWQAQEDATQRIVDAYPLPWSDEFKSRIGAELAQREARYAMDKFNAKATAKESNTMLVGGPSPRLRAMRSLADDIEGGRWA